MIDGHEVRCVVARRFPYVIFFVEHENEIFVVAIAHTRRAPGYWAQRLRG